MAIRDPVPGQEETAAEEILSRVLRG